MKTHLSGHTVYRAEYHIVWIPKYRRRILNPGVAGYFRKLFPKWIGEMPGCEVIEQNIRLDHIHTVMVIPPKYAVSAVVGRIKQASARELREKFPWIGRVYWKERLVWSPGYFVSTVGINEAQIIRYVKWQQRQDSGQAELEF